MITRTRYLALSPAQRREILTELYWHNLQRLHWTLGYCARRGIRLYRVTSALFPMSNEAIGTQVLEGMAANLSSVGRRVERLGIRVVVHPDQFVVLSSDNPKVVATSRTILEKHARAFDLMGLPQSPWSAIIIHGGKADRAAQLVEQVRLLPASVRNRLCPENDEYAYSAEQILAVCRAAGLPMIFDNLHHAIREKLSSYDHPSFGHYVKEAGSTWPRADWQLLHLSNGAAGFLDRNHSQLITEVPAAYRGMKWIEVEARGKEEAIGGLRERNRT